VSMNASPAEESGALAVVLGGKDEIPLRGKLTFVVTTKEVFPRGQKVEVATADGAVKTALSLVDTNLVLQDDHTAVATLDPLKAFGQSAFGPLAMRPVSADGTAGDWTRLGVLVRTPEISAVKCTTGDAVTCMVDGKNLFLVQSFGAAKDFAKSADVPTGFAQGEFAVPTPADGATLYLKLRDDPGAIAVVKLTATVQKVQVGKAEQGRAANAAGKANAAPATQAAVGKCSGCRGERRSAGGGISSAIGWAA